MTPACGSANVASRITYSRLGLCPADRRVGVRNVGGLAYSWDATGKQGRAPVLEGNGTYVYRTSVSMERLLAGRHAPLERTYFDEELSAYAAFSAHNDRVLAAAGIESASACSS